MKKLLSAILICAMLMSIFGIVPGFAASVGGKTYFVEDFENGKSDLVAYASYVEGGFGGTAFAGRISKSVVAGTTGQVAINPDMAFEAVAAAIEPNDVINIKFKYKLLYPVVADSTLSVITTYSLANDDGSKGTVKYDGVDYIIPAPDDTTNWQTVELTQSMPANMWLRAGQTSKNGQYASGFVVRWGSKSSTNGNTIAGATTEESTKVGFLIDDIEISLKGNQNEGSTTVLDGTQNIDTYYSTRKNNALPLDEVEDPQDSTNTVYSVQSHVNTTSNKDVYNLMFFYADAPANIGISAGDKVNFSAKICVTENPNPGTKDSKMELRFYSARANSTLTQIADSGHINAEATFNMAERGWQTLSASFIVPEDNKGVLKGARFRLNDDTDTTTDDGDMKDMGHATFYFDDITYTVISAASKTPSVSELTAQIDAEGNTRATYTFTKGAGDADGTDASVCKFYNDQGGIIKTSDKTTEPMDIPEEYVGENVTLKMVPVSSTGYIGEEVAGTLEATEEDIPSEPVVLKNVPILTATAPKKIALTTANENATGDGKITESYTQLTGEKEVTIPVDVEEEGLYSIAFENLIASNIVRAFVSVDGEEQIPATHLVYKGPGYASANKTNEKIGLLKLKKGRNFITIGADKGNGGGAILAYSITLNLATAADAVDFSVVDLTLKNEGFPRAVNTTREGFPITADVTLKKYGSFSSEYMLLCASYGENNKLLFADVKSIDISQLNSDETKTYTTDIKLKGNEQLVKAMIVEKTNFKPLATAETVITKPIIDKSILDNEVSYQLATETKNNDGNFYADYSKTGEDYKIDAIFYDGYNNTKVFAYMGYPDNASADNKVPAMVLVHGGLGKAERSWVEKWNKLGFAAIAMDLYGRGPENDSSTDSGKKQHPYAGMHPFHIPFSFRTEVKEAGMYQNVVAVVNAHNLLRNSGVVDIENVGITGISWGGVTTTTTIGVDHRFKFAAPVYGCGFLDKSKTYFKDAYVGGSVLWDPANFAARAEMPVLYVNGDTDINFSVDATSWTCEATKNGRMSILHRFAHDQVHGDSVEIVYAFAQAMVADEDPFITVTNDTVENGKFTATLDIPEGTSVQAVTMYYITAEEFVFYNKTDAIDWQTVSEYQLSGNALEMNVPSDATYLYVSIVDQNGYTISSRFIKIN